MTPAVLSPSFLARGKQHRPAQISELLSRLERLGLLRNVGDGHAKGEPNAWTLTPTGAWVAQSLRVPSQGEVV